MVVVAVVVVEVGPTGVAAHARPQWGRRATLGEPRAEGGGRVVVVVVGGGSLLSIPHDLTALGEYIRQWLHSDH